MKPQFISAQPPPLSLIADSYTAELDKFAARHWDKIVDQVVWFNAYLNRMLEETPTAVETRGLIEAYEELNSDITIVQNGRPSFLPRRWCVDAPLNLELDQTAIARSEAYLKKHWPNAQINVGGRADNFIEAIIKNHRHTIEQLFPAGTPFIKGYSWDLWTSLDL